MISGKSVGERFFRYFAVVFRGLIGRKRGARSDIRARREGPVHGMIFGVLKRFKKALDD